MNKKEAKEIVDGRYQKLLPNTDRSTDQVVEMRHKAEGYLERCEQEKAIFGPVVEALRICSTDPSNIENTIKRVEQAISALSSYRRQEGYETNAIHGNNAEAKMSEPSEEIRKAAKQLHIRLHLEGFELDRSVIEQALQAQREATIRECATQCDVDWPLGMPANAIEYAAAEVIKKRILSLLPAKTKEGK